MNHLLSVQNLHVDFQTYIGTIQAVRGVSFDIHEGETVAIVGESGCGKSVTAQAILRLLSKETAVISKGKILLESQNLLNMSEEQIRSVRGNEISMIFQDPMTSLNPTMTIGQQIMEGLSTHQPMGEKELKQRTLLILEKVGIPHPEKRIDQYPHEFSGGMRQRVMIAIALACQPKLLIADEPTTALDVTIQAQILELIKEIQTTNNMSVILITHDLGIVSQMCDRIIVMYAGQVIESGTTDDIFYNPQHPYTKGLLKSVPCPPFKGQRLTPIMGTPPDLYAPPKGCAYTPRCPYAMKICEEYAPVYTQSKEQHFSKCWLHHEQAKTQKEVFLKDIPISHIEHY